jgi:DNA-binding response OmpR family regulator
MARILILNDETDLVDICGIVLREAGHRVDAFTDESRALDLTASTLPDLFILDWKMKHSTGEAVLRQLRTNPRTSTIPVLLVSALPDGGMKARLYGFDGYLQKPFTAQALLHAVDMLLAN